MLLCSFVGRLSVAACKYSIVFVMFSGVRRLLSASYLFSVGVDGLLGVVLCCLLWMVCLRVGFCHSLFGLLLLGGRFLPSIALRTGYIFKF